MDLFELITKVKASGVEEKTSEDYWVNSAIIKNYPEIHKDICNSISIVPIIIESNLPVSRSNGKWMLSVKSEDFSYALSIYLIFIAGLSELNGGEINDGKISRQQDEFGQYNLLFYAKEGAEQDILLHYLKYIYSNIPSSFIYEMNKKNGNRRYVTGNFVWKSDASTLRNEYNNLNLKDTDFLRESSDINTVGDELEIDILNLLNAKRFWIPDIAYDMYLGGYGQPTKTLIELVKNEEISLVEIANRGVPDAISEKEKMAWSMTDKSSLIQEGIIVSNTEEETLFDLYIAELICLPSLSSVAMEQKDASSYPPTVIGSIPTDVIISNIKLMQRNGAIITKGIKKRVIGERMIIENFAQEIAFSESHRSLHAFIVAFISDDEAEIMIKELNAIDWLEGYS